MKRIIFAVFIVWLFLGFRANNAFAQTPTGSELEEIVFQVESSTNVDEVKAADLRIWLENEVTEFMDTGRLAPLFVKMGFRPIHGWKAFAEPAETFYALSMAYPYLSESLQERVRGFLAEEFVDYAPHRVARYPMDAPGFDRRELTRLPADKRTTQGDEVRGGNMISRLYPLWAYAYYTDSWDVISGEWQQIKDIFNGFVGTYQVSPSSEDENMNRYLTGLIGYVRMAHKLGDDAEVRRGLDELARLVPNRLANARWRGDQAAIYLDQYGCDGFGRCPGAGMFIIGRNAAPKLYQFWDLTPELGRLLQNYAPDAMQSCIAFVKRNLSGWYIAGGELTVSAGEPFLENRVDYPHVTLQLFQLMAFIDRPGGDKLKLFANAPISKGDLYHIQKLVRAIQGYGTLCHEDLRTPARECSDQGKSVTPLVADQGDVVTFTITVLGTGQPIDINDPLPDELVYVAGSAGVIPEVGVLSVDGNNALSWTGTLTDGEYLEITFRAAVVESEPTLIWNTAYVNYGDSAAEWSAMVLANGYNSYLPGASNGASLPDDAQTAEITGSLSISTPIALATSPPIPTAGAATATIRPTSAKPDIAVTATAPPGERSLLARAVVFLSSLLVLVGRFLGVEAEWLNRSLPWLR